jgi:predicted nucleic acid-binding protein
LVYVVDASVVLKWFLPEKDSGLADSLLEDFLNGDAELIALDLILLEAANALWKRVELRQELSATEASLIYRDLLTLPISLIGTGPLADRAFQFAIKHKHPVYDAVYCALAIERNCEFITADQTLANKVRGELPFVRHISDMTR